MLALSGLVACTAGQTEQAERRTLKASATTTLTDTSIDNSMTIEAGSLKNTTVDIPSGALAVGTAVDIRRGSTPEDFAISDSTAASSPLVVTASNGDNPLGESQSAMKIAIPLASTGLALMADTSKLVALCKDVYGNLFIWGRDKIAVVDNKAIFQTKRFGTYQLRYVANADSTDFASTSESAPAEKSSEGGESTTPAPSVDTEYQALQIVMNKSCAHASCHGPHEGSANFVAHRSAFHDKKERIKERLLVANNMPPAPDATKPGTSEPYDSAGHSMQKPLSDEDKLKFISYLKKIGVTIPPLPNGSGY